MKKIIALTAILAASVSLGACRGGAPAANNTAAPKAANTAAPVAPPAGNTAAPAGNTAAPAGADATNQNFNLNNRSSHVVTHIYVSPVSQSTWGPDILGRDVLPAGETAQITFPRAETECNWDIKITVDGQQDHTLSNVNLCAETDINYTGE